MHKRQYEDKLRRDGSDKAVRGSQDKRREEVKTKDRRRM